MHGYDGGAMLMLTMSVSDVTPYKQIVLAAFQTLW